MSFALIQTSLTAAYMDKVDEDIKGVMVPWTERLPTVQKWSDVVGIIWADQAGGEVGNLKYVFRQAIVTPITRTIIEEARRRQDPPATRGNTVDFSWPGYKFTPGSEEFAALLGTPHGSGVMFLLATHPNELPGKTVELINIFNTPDVGGDYHMLLTLSG